MNFHIPCSRMLAAVSVLTFSVMPGSLLLAQTVTSLEMMQRLSELRLGELGSPQIKSDVAPPVSSTRDNPHRILIVPVEYANQGFDRFAAQRNAEARNRDYLEELLFDDNLRQPREETLSHYFFHQSKGRYYVTGEVMLPVSVEKPSDYYGMPLQNADGTWRNDARSEELVIDAMKAAYEQNPDFPWQDFDVWDPLDYDGDGVLAESDGYIDHFVLMYAGKAQSSCQGLYNLNQKFTPDAAEDVFDSLPATEQECAQRIWPHRSFITQNNGRGPEVEGFQNRRGGLPLENGLWIYDYNMQSEYTDVSTFIHEFGHSIGLPDIYASQTNNSTGGWDAMSSTASPVPQELSTWSRMVLGWEEPCMIRPTVAGGGKVQSVYLKTMNDWQPGAENEAGVCDSALVILPPKIRELRMGPLQENNGSQAAYTGQGNDLNHYLARTVDLESVNDGPVLMEMDAWFRIETDWDYLYVEVSTDNENWQRLMPTDKTSLEDTDSVMPSKKGHDGIGTIPGFTGRSGDMDGDGRVESNASCDPDRPRGLAEDRIGQVEEDPCEQAQWIDASFDLSQWQGEKITLRFHYFADTAAVEDGALIDNIEIPAIGFYEDFESSSFTGWQVEGFSLSSGSHDIPVPHYYLLEYRDPQAEFENSWNYDSNLDEPGFMFYRNPETGVMEAVDMRYRSGVLMWYYNGSYLWSQNEPAQFGPGNGFLLLVDSNPQEFNLPALPEEYYQDDDGWRFYEFDEAAQPLLRQQYLDVMCYQRRPAYYPSDLASADRAYCNGIDVPPVEQYSFEGRPLLYGFTRINELLPGEEREAFKSVSTLFDYRLSPDGVTWRLYDRALRSAHASDAPFALQDFEDGILIWRPDGEDMVTAAGSPFTAISTFSDSDPDSYLNPHLPFGGVDLPSEGLGFQLAEPDGNAPGSARVKVYFTWEY